MQPSLATGRFIFGTPLHQRPRETRGGVRAPRLSESGLCRGCTRSHRRKAPQIAGDFEIPSAETKTRAKSDTYVAEGAGFEPAIRFPVYTLSRRAPSTARPPLRTPSAAEADTSEPSRTAQRDAAGPASAARTRRPGMRQSDMRCSRLGAAPSLPAG